MTRTRKHLSSGTGLMLAALAALALSCDYGDLDHIPSGFADGVDDQLYFDGTGSELGVADTAARSDHVHDSAYVLKSGDTMTGPLELAADPATDLEAATKQYADTKAATADLNDGSAATAPVGWGDLATRPVAAGAGGNQVVPLTGTATVVRSVTITCPSAGKVIVNAVACIEFTSAGRDFVRMSITTGTTTDSSYLATSSDFGDANTTASSSGLSALRTYSVDAGTYTYRVVCDVGMGSANIRDSNVSAIFIPD